MKKQVIIIIIAVLILIVIGGVIFLNPNKQGIIEEDNKQVEVLKEIYNDFLSHVKNNSAYSISFDESCFKNLVTGNSFSEENKNILKSIEYSNDNSAFEYILYSTYNKKESILTLTLKEKNEMRKQKYKLYNEIKFKREGYGEISTSTPAN